jgi:hypothetical protein
LLGSLLCGVCRRDQGWGKAWGAYQLTGRLPTGMRADLRWQHLHSAFTQVSSPQFSPQLQRVTLYLATTRTHTPLQVAHYELPVAESSRERAVNEIRFDPKVPRWLLCLLMSAGRLTALRRVSTHTCQGRVCGAGQ